MFYDLFPHVVVLHLDYPTYVIPLHPLLERSKLVKHGVLAGISQFSGKQALEDYPEIYCQESSRERLWHSRSKTTKPIPQNVI